MSTPIEPTEPNPSSSEPASPLAPEVADAPPASPADPATVSPATAPKATAPKAKPKVSPARNAVSLVLLVVLLIVGGLELTALFQFKGAVDRLDQALEENEEDLLPKPKVEELLGKTSDIPFVEDTPGMRWTTYTWNGAIRSHVLTAFYSFGEDPGLVKYEIGSASAEDPGGD